MNALSRQILVLIEHHFSDPNFNVQMLADKMGISTTHLRELTWREYGMNPYTLIENKRIRKALTMLEDTDSNLYEVCRVCGYLCPQTLRDGFKKRLHMTPAEIRFKLCSGKRRAYTIKSMYERLYDSVLKRI